MLTQDSDKSWNKMVHLFIKNKMVHLCDQIINYKLISGEGFSPQRIKPKRPVVFFCFNGQWNVGKECWEKVYN